MDMKINILDIRKINCNSCKEQFSYSLISAGLCPQCLKDRNNNRDRKRKREYAKIYRKKNKEKIKKEFKEDKNYIKTKAVLRNQLTNLLKSFKPSKTSPVYKYLGCSLEELNIHLEKTLPKNTAWSDYMCGKLHLDHIIPFNYYIKECGGLTEENLYKVMNYKNLQFLTDKDNWRKHAKYLNR